MNEEILSADQLLQTLNPEGQAANPYPEKIGELDRATFETLLSEATGGRFKALGELDQMLPFRDKFAEASTKLQELEARQKISPFHDPAVSQINQMIGEGRSWDDVAKFIELSRKDVNSISNIEAIALNYELTHGLTREQALEYAHEELGIEIGSDTSLLGQGAQAKLKIKGDEARAQISQKQLQLTSNPMSQQAEQARQQAEQAVSVWRDVLPAVPVILSTALVDQERDIDYSFEYKPSQEIINRAKEEVLNLIAYSPGEYPSNNAGLEKVKKLTNDLVRFYAMDEYVKQLTYDFAAKLRASMVSKNAGTVPARQNATPRSGPVSGQTTRGGKPFPNV